MISKKKIKKKTFLIIFTKQPNLKGKECEQVLMIIAKGIVNL